MNTRQTVLDRLDRMAPWGFTGTLYCLRWIVVVPLALIIEAIFPSRETALEGVNLNILGGFILAPVLETLLECAAPYWAMRRLGWIPADRRAWGFVGISASLMMLLHAGAWPAAILPSLLTGGFLGYTYSHFAPVGFVQALIHTSVFHAAINIVGCILIASA